MLCNINKKQPKKPSNQAFSSWFGGLFLCLFLSGNLFFPYPLHEINERRKNTFLFKNKKLKGTM